MTKYNAVIFDFGEILIHWDPTLINNGSFSDDKMKEFFESDLTWSINDRLDAGADDDKEIEYFSVRRPDLANLAEYFFKHTAQGLTGPTPYMEEVINTLKNEGYRVYGLTNWHKGDIETAAQMTPAIQALDAYIVSSEVGLIKPDPQIFDMARKRFNVDPSKTLFVDDKEINLEGAKSIGFDTFQMKYTPSDKENWKNQVKELIQKLS